MRFMLKGAVNQDAKLIMEDFFPINAVFDETIENIAHIGFYYGSEDLLEFAVDRITGNIRSMKLTLCKHYSLVNSNLEEIALPIVEPESLDIPTDVMCKQFHVSVFQDGVRFILSDSIPVKKVCVRNLAFSLAENDEIVSISIARMSSDIIAHCVLELQYME